MTLVFGKLRDVDAKIRDSALGFGREYSSYMYIGIYRIYIYIGRLETKGRITYELTTCDTPFCLSVIDVYIFIYNE